MPLNGEMLFWRDAWTGNSTVTATFTVEFPPAAVMAKVSPAFYMEYGSPGMLGTRLVSIRRRLISDADETVSTGDVPAVFDGRMTSVTFALFIYNCQARILLDLGFWS